MIVLAIDPGTRCGWAVRDGARAAASGVWNLAPPRGASPGTRYLYLLARLREVRVAYPALRLVAYELAHQRGGAATEYAIGVATHLQSWCAEERLEHLAIHSATVKRLATGRGNAKKPEMLAAAQRRWPDQQVSDDNHADALWIAEAALQEVGGR